MKKVMPRCGANSENPEFFHKTGNILGPPGKAKNHKVVSWWP